MNKALVGVLLAVIFPIVFVVTSWWYLNQSKVSEVPQAEGFPNIQQQSGQQQGKNDSPKKSRSDNAMTPPPDSGPFECTSQLAAEGTDGAIGWGCLKSPNDQYYVHFDYHSPDYFRIVSAKDKLISSYSPIQGKSIICEIVCYPFAEWLGNTTLIIGSYSLVNNTWGSENPAKRYEAVVFDVSTKGYRPATPSEIAQFDLYNDASFNWE